MAMLPPKLAVTALPIDKPKTLPGADRLPHGGSALIVRLSALGDVLFALETVAALHRERPDVAIDFLVEDRFQSLLEAHPQIRHTIVYPRRRLLGVPAAVHALRRHRYDVVLDVHGNLKSAAHVFFARARHKLGPAAPGAREGAARAYHQAVPMPVPLPHRADIGHRLLAAIGLSGVPAAPVLAGIDPRRELFANLPGPRVFLHPGTSAWAQFKRWPVAHFAELAARLARRGCSVLVGYGPGERELAAPILAALPTARVVDGAQLGLRGLYGALRHVDVVVAADTGPLHLGAAAGACCVALFGPKDPLRYGPRAHGNQSHEVLFHDVPCRPCRRRTCVTPQCVLGIAVDAAEAAVMRLAVRAGVR